MATQLWQGRDGVGAYLIEHICGHQWIYRLEGSLKWGRAQVTKLEGEPCNRPGCQMILTAPAISENLAEIPVPEIGEIQLL